MVYQSKIHLKLKSREVSFAHNLFCSYSIVLKFCTEQHVLFAKIQNYWTTETNVITERDFARCLSCDILYCFFVYSVTYFRSISWRNNGGTQRFKISISTPFQLLMGCVSSGPRSQDVGHFILWKWVHSDLCQSIRLSQISINQMDCSSKNKNKTKNRKKNAILLCAVACLLAWFFSAKLFSSPHQWTWTSSVHISFCCLFVHLPTLKLVWNLWNTWGYYTGNNFQIKASTLMQSRRQIMWYCCHHGQQVKKSITKVRALKPGAS